MNRGTVWFIAIIGIFLVAGIMRFSMESTRNRLPILDALGGEFALPSTLGRVVRLSDLRGKVVLLNFGFTSCPDVCPTVLARMQTVLDAFPAAQQIVQPVFITIDPARDTVETLRSYLSSSHPSFIGMSGTAEQIAEVAASYKVYSEQQPPDATAAYGFIHSDHIYLLDQQGRIRATYDSSVRIENIVASIESLL